MDLILLIGLATSLLIILITLFFFQRKFSASKEEGAGTSQAHVRGVDRRSQIARNQRNRIRNNADAHVPVPSASIGGRNQQRQEDDSPQAELPDEKMGAKKRAKLEAKAEKKAIREAEIKAREERKKKEALAEEEKRKEDEKEAEELRKVEEAEKQAKLEKERREQEEYMKLKAAFTVDEEGFAEGDEDEKDNLLSEFMGYIKDNKVVILEDLATHFKLKTQQAIDRITDLQESGSLTGVIDDRGKFIYISEEELRAVAKFIKQRGRVSITELAESSATLINLVNVA